MGDLAGLAYAAGGLVAGFLLGWTSRAAGETTRIREVLMGQPDDRHRRAADRKPWRRRLSGSDAVLAVLVVIVLASTVTTWRVNERIDRITDCRAQVTTQLVRAVNERTTYSAQSTDRQANLLSAQQQLLTSVADPSQTERQQRAAIRDYTDAVDAYRATQAKAAAKRAKYDYPTTDQIRKCR